MRHRFDQHTILKIIVGGFGVPHSNNHSNWIMAPGKSGVILSDSRVRT